MNQLLLDVVGHDQACPVRTMSPSPTRSRSFGANIKILLLGAGSSLVLAAVSAEAAPRRYVVPTVPVYNWTGCYVGGNAGYSWGRAQSDISSATFGAFSGSSKLDGFIGGGQVGCNWQYGPNWVWGVETDFQGSTEKGSWSRSGTFTNGEGTSTFSNTLEARLRWFGTLRARAGYLVTPTLLVYGTGGLAYGSVKITDTITVNTGTIVTSVLSQTSTNTGWTLGAGVEGVFWGNYPNWTWKIEYLYIDLGRFNGGGTDPVGGAFAWSTRVTDNIVRLGINYKFNGPTR